MKLFFSSLIAAIIFVAPLSRTSAEIAPGSEVVELGSNGVANFLKVLEEKKGAHVAFIGGSITQNQKGHTQMIPEWLEANWPDVKFTFTNAGLSSTCSVSGAFRFQRDVLSKGPIDLLVVEFAVNDDQDAGHERETAIRGLEGIFRQFFRSNPHGSVISVQYVNPPILEKLMNGETAVSVAAHKDVARHYGVSLVDVGLALAREIEAGNRAWKEDYGGTHPNQPGYRFASDLIIGVFERSHPSKTIEPIDLPEPLDENSYEFAIQVDPQLANWLGGWEWDQVSRELLPEGQIRPDYEVYQAIRSSGAGDHLYFSFAGTKLGAFVLAGPDSGALEVSVDAGEWKRVELYHFFSKNLNYPRSVILADDLDRRYHQVAIRVAESANPEGGDTATILFFQVNQ